MSPRAAGLLLSAFALLAAVPAALAKPPAAGAPGARHTWAPADKHGFGTAHQLAGHTYFTLRQASLSEVYYPDLSTPSFRGLQFAVTDGRTFVDREVVDDDPRHIEPVAPGVTATVTPLERTLGYRQVTENARWRLTKTYITDPARDTVLMRVRFEAKTRDRAAAVRARRPGARQRRQRRPRQPERDDADRLRRHRRERRRRLAGARARPRAATAGRPATRGATCRTTRSSGTDATQAGNVVQGARTGLDGKDNQSMTLAIGFGRDAGAATAAATGSLAGGFDAAQAAYDSGLERLPGLAEGAAGARRGQRPDASGSTSSRCSCSPASRTRSTAAPRSPRPNMPWVWGTLTLSGSEQTPTRTTWSGRATSTTRPPPRRRRATTRPPTGSSTTCGRCRRPTARSGRTRASTARRSGRASSSTRRRCRSCSPGGWAARPRRTGTTSARRPTT